MSHPRASTLFPCVWALACVVPTDPLSDTGEATSCATAPLSMVIGETVEGGMTDLDGVDEPTLVYGPQGGHHLPLALRVSGLGPAPDPLLLEMEATLDGSVRVGGFLRELEDPRPEGSREDATWLDLWLVVDTWPLDRVRVVSATIAELAPCESAASTERTFSPPLTGAR